MGDAVLTDLHVYPVKSARGIALDAAELDAFGLRHDRRWMVVDAANRMVTQRERPRMALVRTALEAGRLVLTAPGLEPLALPLEPRPGPRVRVSVWRGGAEAIVVEGEAAGWFDEHLGGEFRLVYMPDDIVRPVAPEPGVAAGRLSFTDAYPLLLISGEALDHLNERLERPVPMNRFRPNLVVRGAGPHAEDGWRRIRIGGVAFHVAEPCARCAVPAIDQETGVRGKEPNRTLAAYRRRGGAVLFGQNLIHAGTGALRVGDAVEVLERAPAAAGDVA